MENKCNHDKYRAANYMSFPKAMEKMKASEICWIGKVVTHCECGEDISHARRVRVKTFEEYMREIK